MTFSWFQSVGLRLFGLTPSKFEKALPALAALVADYQAAEPDIKAAIDLWNNKLKGLVERNKPRLEDAMLELDTAMPAIQETLKLVGANRIAGKPLPAAVKTTEHALKAATPGTTTRWLQETLSKLGYRIVIDGDYGVHTRAAVRQFQFDHKLDVDGWAGPTTTALLHSALEAIK